MNLQSPGVFPGFVFGEDRQACVHGKKVQDSFR